MDFGELLNAAKKNENNKNAVSYYKTKFTPPKKENRQSKILSNNIKKFLAKKEEEEKRKAEEEKLKKQKLLALRDHKAQSRINKHLKVCKSANKSVLEDAVDTENTAITAAGPSQPDEDDYGYVSQEASAFYNKLMNKYNSLPPEKSIFSSSGKKTVKDIASTKDRVKQALKQQEIEDSQGHRKRRKLSSKNSEESSAVEVTSEEKTISESTAKPEKIKPKNKALPPPIDFLQLLKLAEQKQHEPIMVEVKPKIEEPERLYTKKQLREEKKYSRSEKSRVNENTTTETVVENNRLDKSAESNKTKKIPASKPSVSTASPVQTLKKPSVRPNDKHTDNSKILEQKEKDKAKEDVLKERRKLEIERKKLEEMRRSIEEEKRKLSAIKAKRIGEEKRVNSQPTKVNNQIASKSGQESNSINRGKQISSISLKKPDLYSQNNMKNMKAKMLAKKKLTSRRPLDDDYDEYDSELDDFIDNDQDDENADYSKYISEIFGYDKNKYKNYDDDDRGMESNFAQQLKEEYVSTRIGIMEDLEDIRQEAKEKKRKALVKKKKYV